jgi:hypothetical protein
VNSAVSGSQPQAGIALGQAPVTLSRLFSDDVSTTEVLMPILGLLNEDASSKGIYLFILGLVNPLKASCYNIYHQL